MKKYLYEMHFHTKNTSNCANVKAEIASASDVTVVNKTTGETFKADCELSDRTRAIIIAGGLLDYTKENS